MRYLLLIYGEEPTEAPSPEAAAAQTAAYDAYTRDLQTNGQYQAGEALHPTAAATTVRVRDGELVATDGPFAETKEALGGFYLVDARDLDEAIELAGRIPGAAYGSIEIRPIFEFAPGQMGFEEAAGVAG